MLPNATRAAEWNDRERTARALAAFYVSVLEPAALMTTQLG